MSEEVTLNEFTESTDSGDSQERQDTPIGELPTDWGVEWLKDVVKINPDGFSEEDWPSETFEYISLSETSDGEIEDSQTTPLEDAPSRAQRTVQQGDVLVGTVRPKQRSHGFVNEAHGGKICSSGFGVLRTETRLNSRYLLQEILSNRFFSQMEAYVAGSGYPAVKVSDLKKHRVAIPPLHEQRKIATVLYTVDRAIEKAEQIDDQLSRIKTAVTHNLLSGIGSDKPVKSVRVGPKELELPKGWRVEKIADISDIKNGNRIVKGHDYSESVTEYPFIRIVDMENGTVSTDDIKYLKQETAEKMTRGIINSGDVYITVTGRVGDAGTIPDELDGARFTDNAAKLYNLEGILPEYLSLYLRSKFGQDEVHRFTVGSSQPKLSMYRVEKMEVIVPPLKKQERIIGQINEIKDAKEANEDIICHLNSLKRGLMQDLLSGTVRTTDTNIEVPEEIAIYG